MKPISIKEVFMIKGDIIYINAQHRRGIMDKWVYCSIGDKNTVRLLMRKIRESKDVQVSQDIEYWRKRVQKQNKEGQK